MKKSFVLIILIALTFVPALLEAATYNYEDAHVSITIPDTWSQKFETDSDEEGDTLIVTSPKGEIALLFFVLESNEIETALDQLEKDLTSTLNDLEFNDDTEEFTINGMQAISISGKAEKGKLDVEIDIVITPAAKCLTILNVSSPDVFKKYEKDIILIVQGIQPIEEEEEEEEE